MSNPSQHQANNLYRVLAGKPLKYTVRVYFPDGRALEWQSETIPKIDFEQATRSVWLNTGSPYYASIMEWITGMAMLVEINPEAKETKA